MLDADTTTVDAWVGFGFGRFSRKPGRTASALDGMARQIRELKRSGPCATQLQVFDTDSFDGIREEERDLAATAARAWTTASASGRPLLLSDEVPDTAPPLFMPLTDGKGATIQIRLTDKDLAMPGPVSKGFTFDGYAQYASALRAQVRGWETLGTARTRLAQMGEEWQYAIEGYEFEGYVHCAQALADAPLGVKEIQEIERRYALVADLLGAWESLPGHEKGVAAIQKRESVSALQELAGFRKGNERALSACRAAGPSSDVRGEVVRASMHTGGRPEFLADLEKVSPEEVTRKLANARKELREVEAEMAKAASRSDLSILVDAFLRGWPATFGEVSNEKAYDAWMDDHRADVWSGLRAQLAGRGIPTQSGDDRERMAGFLHRSNVVFRVDRADAGWSVTPYFMLSGAWLLVADPGVPVIRYEGILADQHLVSWKKVDEVNAAKGETP